MAAEPYVAVPDLIREMHYWFGNPGPAGDEGRTIIAKRMIDVVHHADIQEVLRNANSIESSTQG